MATCTTKRGRSSPPTTSSIPDAEFLFTAFTAHEKTAQHLIGEQLALPAYEQVLKAAHLQPAGRTRRHQRYRARRLHWPHPQPGAAPWAKLPGQPRRLGFPHGAKAHADECWPNWPKRQSKRKQNHPLISNQRPAKPNAYPSAGGSS